MLTKKPPVEEVSLMVLLISRVLYAVGQALPHRDHLSGRFIAETLVR